jgi:hypothetical protein
MKRLNLFLLVGMLVPFCRNARADGQCCTCPEVAWHTNITCRSGNCQAMIGIYFCSTTYKDACEHCVSTITYCCGTGYASKTEGTSCAGPPGARRLLTPRDVMFPTREGGYQPIAGVVAPGSSRRGGGTP